MFRVDELITATEGRLTAGDAGTMIKGISIDSRSIAKGEAFVAIKGNNLDGHDFIAEALRRGASCIIRERRAGAIFTGKVPCIEVASGVEALGGIARYHRDRFDIPVIAVTGSNGKTTTKEMIAQVLCGQYRVLKNEGTKNNHIGVPMTLLGLKASVDIVVLELGTNHFGEISYLADISRPTVGIVTGIGPAHLEHFGSLGGVFREKYSLVKKLAAPAIAVLNADDVFLRRAAPGSFVLGFGIKRSADYRASSITAGGRRIDFSVNRKFKFTIGTGGYYNIYNALAAVAVGRLFGIGYRELSRRLSAFRFPQGRLTLLSAYHTRFLDDTYNANPASLSQALETLANFSVKGRKIFVMGDMRELGRQARSFHCAAGRSAARVCDALITVGELAKLSAKTAQGSNAFRGNVYVCASAPEARRTLLEKVRPGKDDIVLVKGSRAMKMEEVFAAKRT